MFLLYWFIAALITLIVIIAVARIIDVVATHRVDAAIDAAVDAADTRMFDAITDAADAHAHADGWEAIAKRAIRTAKAADARADATITDAADARALLADATRAIRDAEHALGAALETDMTTRIKKYGY